MSAFYVFFTIRLVFNACLRL